MFRQNRCHTCFLQGFSFDPLNSPSLQQVSLHISLGLGDPEHSMQARRGAVGHWEIFWRSITEWSNMALGCCLLKNAGRERDFYPPHRQSFCCCCWLSGRLPSPYRHKSLAKQTCILTGALFVSCLHSGGQRVTCASYRHKHDLEKLNVLFSFCLWTQSTVFWSVTFAFDQTVQRFSCRAVLGPPD